MQSSQKTGNHSFWAKQNTKALAKAKYRATRQSITNIDYQIKYPNECRNNPDNRKGVCHPDAIKRITHEHEKRIQTVQVPKVIRPARTNRN